MADQERKAPVVNLAKDDGTKSNQSGTAHYLQDTSAEMATSDTLVGDYYNEGIKSTKPGPGYLEETSAEMAAPATFGRGYSRERDRSEAAGGTGIGFAAIILSILSLFVAPILFGAAGIVLGFVARRRGSTGLGSWAIGIGAISIILGMFILPFF